MPPISEWHLIIFFCLSLRAQWLKISECTWFRHGLDHWSWIGFGFLFGFLWIWIFSLPEHKSIAPTCPLQSNVTQPGIFRAEQEMRTV